MSAVFEDPNRLADLSKPTEPFLERFLAFRDRIFGLPHMLVREAVYMQVKMIY